MKAAAAYVTHRPDRSGERAYRAAFDRDDDHLEKAELSAWVNLEEGEFGYRIILSPGRDLDAGEVREWTREVMLELESRHEVSWVAVAHAGESAHTEHPHVHVLAFTEEKLEVEDFRVMRATGDIAAERVLEHRAHLERDDLLTSWDDLEREGPGEVERDSPGGAGRASSGLHPEPRAGASRDVEFD